MRLQTWLLLAAGMTVTAAGDQTPRCAMSPPYGAIDLPAAGLVWAKDEVLSGPCDEPATGTWLRGPAGSLRLFVHPDGPSGSGRYWTIAIGTAPANAPTPVRGICLMTSTAGWPILRHFGDGALPWLDDLDADGRAEAIVWLSFFLSSEQRQWESGLMAWVYRLEPADRLALDLGLSRRMAGEIAAAYRRAPPGADARFLEQWGGERRKAAEALEAMADGRCSIAQ
jgi:hypothetical protein